MGRVVVCSPFAVMRRGCFRIKIDKILSDLKREALKPGFEEKAVDIVSRARMEIAETCKEEMRMDDKERIKELQKEIFQLEIELDVAVTEKEGGDQANIRDLIVQKNNEICRLQGLTVIEMD